MPELPEVETVRRILEKEVKGRTIAKVDVLYPRLIQSDLNEFTKDIVGLTIEEVRRVGKFLVLILGSKALLIHLRMEGKLFHLNGLEDNLDKYTTLYFTLDDGSYLFFKDTRKFGVMYLKDATSIYDEAPLNKIGPEPFEIEDMDYLAKKYARMSLPLKSALLDQSVMCGLGNIYADETLFKARLTPFMKASSVTPKMSKDLILGAREILSEAIERGGSTIKSYHAAEGMTGRFQNLLKVYGRGGKPCTVCGDTLEKRFIGGRSVTFCHRCQKVPYAIGLTGEIASGKSTVLKIFKDLGATVYSADEIVHKLYVEKSFIAKVKEHFPEVIKDDQISKDTIYKKFLKDPKFKHDYEVFVWKAVSEKIGFYLSKDSKNLVVFEIPLLFDSKLDKKFSYNVGVETSEERRMAFLEKREKDKSKRQALISRSNHYQQNRDKLDFIIDNDGNIEHLTNLVKEIYDKLKI